MKSDFGSLIYSLPEDDLSVDVIMKDDTIWLSQKGMAELFDVGIPAINKHLKNIFEDGELSEKATVSKMEIVQNEGNRRVERTIAFHNLDAIISVGYRVNSKRATKFRIWATSVLKEYMTKGFAMDDERLKNLGGGNYFKELLDRIRDIRSSEKVFYRQVLDIFATSIDYDPKSQDAKLFFANVQNKMHYSVHSNTAAELVYKRVDSDKEFMGLSSFKGELPSLSEAKTAKNYLSEEELNGLNNLVSGYLEFAQRQAQRKNIMTMKDWADHIDRILTGTGENLLVGGGKISKAKMSEKVDIEYKKYSAKTLTQVEKDYLNEIQRIERLAGKRGAEDE